ncbi:Inosine-5'-monophosphate dehydrogenase [Fundidesulfovibrio magnetotacticus]|uniref:Inosine-5'-monophosphate dehydrogenase n=1 Tax=Fundidesulfovibrio magnetotacticus TaxID=2730080 RepID=A0A6V8LX60_9BACT|nr:CBS domain-containing protein [Fundidesulfovibrio magnetotacticus]GFK95171.1 Inosine-5'-monophosphate dehydrogenase [Fundidesulfovibrio magnetotacticus]
MLKAKDIMTAQVVTLTPDTSIAEAAQTLLEKRINGCPVVNASGKLVGILCQSDLVAQQKRLSLPTVFTLLDGLVPMTSMADLDREMEKIAAISVSQAMTPDPQTVTPETPVEDVATLMVDRGFHTVPVMEAGRVCGVIGMEDILRTLSARK